MDTLAGRRVRDPAGYSYTTPVRPNDGAEIATAAPSLTWIGHATFVLRLGGVLVATDPDLVRPHLGRHPPPRPTRRRPRGPAAHRRRHDQPQPLRPPRPADAPPHREAGPLRHAAGQRADPARRRARQGRGAGLVAIAPGRRPHRSPRCRRGTGRCARPGTATTCCGAASCFAAPRASPTTRATPRCSTASPRSASAPVHLTGRCCRSAPTSPRWFMEAQHMNPEDAGQAFERLRRAQPRRHALGHVQAHRRAARRSPAAHRPLLRGRTASIRRASGSSTSARRACSDQFGHSFKAASPLTSGHP